MYARTLQLSAFAVIPAVALIIGISVIGAPANAATLNFALGFVLGIVVVLIGGLLVLGSRRSV